MLVHRRILHMAQTESHPFLNSWRAPGPRAPRVERDLGNDLSKDIMVKLEQYVMGINDYSSIVYLI